MVAGELLCRFCCYAIYKRKHGGSSRREKQTNEGIICLSCVFRRVSPRQQLLVPIRGTRSWENCIVINGSSMKKGETIRFTAVSSCSRENLFKFILIQIHPGCLECSPFIYPDSYCHSSNMPVLNSISVQDEETTGSMRFSLRCVF